MCAFPLTALPAASCRLIWPRHAHIHVQWRAEIRGSAPAVLLPSGEYLGLGHTVARGFNKVYKHVFYTFKGPLSTADAAFGISGLSEPFEFPTLSELLPGTDPLLSMPPSGPPYIQFMLGMQLLPADAARGKPERLLISGGEKDCAALVVELPLAVALDAVEPLDVLDARSRFNCVRGKDSPDGDLRAGGTFFGDSSFFQFSPHAADRLGDCCAVCVSLPSCSGFVMPESKKTCYFKSGPLAPTNVRGGDNENQLLLCAKRDHFVAFG